jgi:hypothetical protein
VAKPSTTISGLAEKPNRDQITLSRVGIEGQES